MSLVVFCGYGGSVWVMGEWGVGQWIVDITSFQKIYGLYGPNILKKVLQWKSWSDDGQTDRVGRVKSGGGDRS